MKSYSAQSGYVYQYSYEGYRASEAHGGCAEFVFTTSADRTTWKDLSIFVQEASVRGWQERHGRELSSTERYAIAKMALFAAFDERTSPAELTREAVLVRESDIDGIVGTLGLL